jgi:hypothetical protein
MNCLWEANGTFTCGSTGAAGGSSAGWEDLQEDDHPEHIEGFRRRQSAKDKLRLFTNGPGPVSPASVHEDFRRRQSAKDKLRLFTNGPGPVS